MTHPPSDKPPMSFDAVVANPGRLQILTALAVDERQDFVQLRRVTRLTDGNLSSHAKRLQSAGMVQIDKQFRDGKPVTSFTLTPTGRRALESHVRRLLAAMSQRRIVTSVETGDELAEQVAERSIGVEAISTPAVVATADDWVD